MNLLKSTIMGTLGSIEGSIEICDKFWSEPNKQGFVHFFFSSYN